MHLCALLLLPPAFCVQLSDGNIQLPLHALSPPSPAHGMNTASSPTQGCSTAEGGPSSVTHLHPLAAEPSGISSKNPTGTPAVIFSATNTFSMHLVSASFSFSARRPGAAGVSTPMRNAAGVGSVMKKPHAVHPRAPRRYLDEESESITVDEVNDKGMSEGRGMDTSGGHGVMKHCVKRQRKVLSSVNV